MKVLIPVFSSTLVVLLSARSLSNPQHPVAPNVKAQSVCGGAIPVSQPKISYGFGRTPDPFNPGQKRWHYGIDYEAPIGTPVLSPACGKVIFAGQVTNPEKYDYGYGLQVRIKDDRERIHLLAHLSRIDVKKGDLVKVRQPIAAVGNTGNSTGPHLHHEVRIGRDSLDNTIDPRNAL